MIGWDIGGVNTKVARVAGRDVVLVRARPYELQRAPDALASVLRELASEVGAGAPATHAVTMTAELSQIFRTKRDGVAFVLDAVASAFPSSAIRVFAVDGRFLALEEARRTPLAVAAANWAATAQAIAQHHPDALLVDIGTTTTDIIPIVDGAVAVEALTDPDRLASGELVYTGAVRTPAEAIASHVPLGGKMAGVSAEGFALAGDVHVWRGDLDPNDYSAQTPDGRPATREFAGERLARVVCADRDLLDEAAVSSIAGALAGAQVARITAAIERVLARHPSLRTAVVTGLGAFLGDAAARAAGLQVVLLAGELGDAAARYAPAVSVALLLERALAGSGVEPDGADLTARGESLAAFGAPNAAAALGTPFDGRCIPAPPQRGCRVGDPGAGCVAPPSNTPGILGRRALPAGRLARLGATPDFHHGLLKLRTTTEAAQAFRPAVPDGTVIVDTVVKLGGGLLAYVEHFDAALATIAAAARAHRLLIVPGGGPFAATVRAVDGRLALPDDAAHWMAVLAMDQYAHLIAARLAGGVLVAEPCEIAAALAEGHVPVLAPTRWLRDADPLPHTWDVTGDSIAAWIAGAVGARRLVLIKPPGATGSDVMDAYFPRALPPDVASVIVAADQMDAIKPALGVSRSTFIGGPNRSAPE